LLSAPGIRAKIRSTIGEATAENPAVYGIGVAFLLTMGVASFPSAAASATHASRPCGEVMFEYSAARVQPGQTMDMELIVNNCSHRPERLRVNARSHGPCHFAHPVDHTYSLPAQWGVGSSTLLLVPSCAGRYSVHIKLELAGQHRALDVAGDGFAVRRHKIRS